MKITVADCIKLDALKSCRIMACENKLDNRVRTVSVYDEVNVELGLKRNASREQMVLTHFWHCPDDIDTQVEIVRGLGKGGVACLIVFLHDDGLSSISDRLIKEAEKSGLLLLAVKDEQVASYAFLIEQVLDKILYGHNYSDNIINNTIYNLLKFENHLDFQDALKEAAINNAYQVVLLSNDFDQLLTIETRQRASLENVLVDVKKLDIKHSSEFTKVETNGIISYWGTIDVSGIKHILGIIDNDDDYSSPEMKKLAQIIELAMGMWNYTPARDSQAEFIKAAIRGDYLFCKSLIDEAGLRDKVFASVFYASDIDVKECQQVVDEYQAQAAFKSIILAERNEVYGMLYVDRDAESMTSIKAKILAMYDALKEGRKNIRVFHSTAIEDLDTAVDSFKMINDTYDSVGKVFPYKRVFSKYEMSMVLNCIGIRTQNASIKRMYFELLEPFEREISANKGKVLMETLETFVLDAGMNSLKTSEIMNVHNNTVQYRLKKINELLGAEMMGNRVIPGLTMALALNRLEGN